MTTNRDKTEGFAMVYFSACSHEVFVGAWIMLRVRGMRLQTTRVECRNSLILQRPTTAMPDMVKDDRITNGHDQQRQPENGHAVHSIEQWENRAETATEYSVIMYRLSV